jgi:hypothetical protein
MFTTSAYYLKLLRLNLTVLLFEYYFNISPIVNFINKILNFIKLAK